MADPSLASDLARGIAAGDRKALAKAITLVESTAPLDQRSAVDLLAQLAPRSGAGAYRIGVTGAPGVGKSTFIDTLGMLLIEQGFKVAVLSVDPSGVHSGGSILGDKTRMAQLASHEQAFVRPSPAGSARGGVASSTAEAVQLCEAAGYGVVIVESVGVGQQEHGVRHVVDFVLMLVNPGAGDQIQGLKRGILEVVDCVAVNKADNELRAVAEQTRAEYQAALSVSSSAGIPAVLTLSAREGHNVQVVWDLVQQQRASLQRDGELLQRRSEQTTALFWELLRATLLQHFIAQPEVARRKEQLLESLQGNAITPRVAVHELLQLLKS